MLRHVDGGRPAGPERHRPGLAGGGRGGRRHATTWSTTTSGTPSLAVRRGADLLATGARPHLPEPDGLWPGTGAILAAVEVAIGPYRRDRGQAGAAAVPHGPRPLGEGRTLVVGDRVDTDVAAAAGAPRRRPGAHGRRHGRGGGGARAETGRDAATWPSSSADRATPHRSSPQARIRPQGLPPAARRARKIDGVHRVATGRIKPRWAPDGRAPSPRSGAPTRAVDHDQHRRRDRDAYVVTDRPDAVEAAMRERGWTAVVHASRRRLRRDRQPRLGRVRPARPRASTPRDLVQVRGAHAPPRSRCAGRRAPPPRPRLRSSRRSSGEQLLERLGALGSRDATGTWCQSSPAAS